MELDKIRLWTALITPLNDDNSVDYDSLEKLVRAQEEAGNGLLALGSTGEALNLDEEEKKEILNFILKLKPQVPLMVGIGGINLKSTVEQIREYEKTPGIDAYLLVTPLYSKPGPTGQEVWFRSLMDESSKPCMLYNVPSRTGVYLHTYTVEQLRDHPRFWAIKEASGSVEEFCRYSQAAGSKVKLYSGDDAMIDDFAPHGAAGVVSVAGNCWPLAARAYVENALNGGPSAPDLWKEVCGTLFLASNPTPVKALMASKGDIKFPHLRSPLDHRDMVGLELVQASDKNIQDWYNNNIKKKVDMKVTEGSSYEFAMGTSF
jgi:4-hydroxy-tetrahydrodipicolinate synthase